MKILAVDTSAVSSSVSIVSDGKVLSSCYTNTGLTHSQTLMPMIDFAVKNSGISVSDIDYFAVNNGPGSFTGVRIGVAAIKGLAQATGKKCVEVSTLESLAYNSKDANCLAVCAMDARCNQVYTAAFVCENGKCKRVTEDSAMLISETEKSISAFDLPILFIGDGARLLYEYYKDKLNCSLASENIRYQNAASTALCAQEKIKRGETVSAQELMPLYLRLPQAERELKKKISNEKELNT